MPGYPDIVLYNAYVYTVDPLNPQAQAVAIQGKRILFVGSNEAALTLCGPTTQRIDASGRTLIPGIIDSHFHLLWGSLKIEHLQLDSAKDPQHFADLVRNFAAEHPEKEWIEGVQVRYITFANGPVLDRHFLDALVPDRPVYLTAYDGHTVWVNSEALRRAELSQGRQLPAGHEIVLDPVSGLATGELREPEAFDPVRRLIPKPDLNERRRLLRNGLQWLASLGITSVHNMDNWNDAITIFSEFEQNDEMSLRVYVPFDIRPETPLDAIANAVEMRQQHHGDYVRAGAVKLFMDGVIESTTGLMLHPYADAPHTIGGALFSAEHFNQIAERADRLGLQIAVHCCGDGAVRRTLDGFAHAQQVNGKRDSRHRIEHIEVCHPDDVSRFAQLGVTASMQPLHCPKDLSSEVWTSRVGAERWTQSFPWQTLRKAGAHLVFGSDWPVVTPNPMTGINAALNRKPWVVDHPSQAQSLPDTLAAYTRDAAYAEFMENEKGMIRRGMLADLVLFSENIFAKPKEEILQIQPVLTICNGKIVFSR